MALLMILQGGPLDGEEEIVEGLPSAPGTPLSFYLPHFQVLDQDGAWLSTGITSDYAVVGPGPPPTTGDTWTSSLILEYTGGPFTPPPPNINPSGVYAEDIPWPAS
jgi:hypothetical protein